MTATVSRELLDTKRAVPTPEGIELEVKTAGPVVRAFAWVIDLFARLGIVAACSLVFAILGEFGGGLMLILWFALEWLYPAIFETYWGATPGKRAMGLVVLHDDGTPVELGSAFVRNLLRAVDFLPFLYGFGLLSMLLNRDCKRIGDLAAGTVVAYAHEQQSQLQIPEADPTPSPLPLSLDAQRAVLDFATRLPSLTDERADELAALLPELTGGAREHPRLNLLAIANHIAGRRR